MTQEEAEAAIEELSASRYDSNLSSRAAMPPTRTPIRTSSYIRTSTLPTLMSSSSLSTPTTAMRLPNPFFTFWPARVFRTLPRHLIDGFCPSCGTKRPHARKVRDDDEAPVGGSHSFLMP